MAKTMIFLIDGTANDATEATFSNVYAVNQIIAGSKKSRSQRSFKERAQVTFYIPGVGTKFTVKQPSGGVGSWFGTYEKVRQQLFGDRLEQIVLRAYINLCANYKSGDKIIIIGFSRGAAAARIFSRLISDFGILVPDMLIYMDRMWNNFVNLSSLKSDIDYEKGIRELRSSLRQQAGRNILHVPKGTPIAFLGLFDTVMGKGDKYFSVNVHLRDRVPAKGVSNIVHLLSMHETRKDFELIRLEAPRHKMKVREIWIPGVHSDVGGGYDEDFISSISLLTMTTMLHEIAGVAIERKAFTRIIRNIRRKMRESKMVINKEGRGRRYSKVRIEQMKDGDEIHPLHDFLVDKLVCWKKDPGLTPYRDFSDCPFKLDARLARRFRTWVR